MARRVEKTPDLGKRRSRQSYVKEQAAVYGVNLPVEPAPAERYLSPNEIGKILDVTGEAVKQWIYHRRLPAVKLSNGYWKIKVSDFEDFLKNRHNIGRRRILITDPRTGGFTEVINAIEQLGHQISVAQNYADALLKAMDHYPSLFVVNLSIKDHDAWKLAEKIRSTKALRTIPMLLLADAELSEVDADRALGLGAQGFLKQPIKTEMLSEEIKRILDRSA